MTQTYKDIQTPLTTLVNELGKNAADVLCPKPTCNCIILRKNTGTLIEGDGSKLTLPSSSLTATDLPEDNDTHFWRMTSMMDFENVGFSTTVGTIKYLSCADCDLGPIGYHDTTHPKEFVISIQRARYRF